MMAASSLDDGRKLEIINEDIIFIINIFIIYFIIYLLFYYLLFYIFIYIFIYFYNF